MTSWVVPLITVAGSIGVGSLSVLGAWLVARRTGKAAEMGAEAQVQLAINDGFKTLTATFQAELTETRGELTEARAEITDLRGWIRNLLQHVESLEELLRAAGVEIPARRVGPHPLTVIRGAGEGG